MPFTIQQVGKRLLHRIGVTQFQPQPAGSDLPDVTDSDLDEVAACISGAMQEIHDQQPAVNMEVHAGGVLPGPTNLTLTTITNSQVISAVTTWAAWMAGCTVRITGDDQDNQFVSATRLARPFMGAGASGIAAQVFGDCLTLESNHSRALGPIFLPNQLPLNIADTFEQFLRETGWTDYTNGRTGQALYGPDYLFIRKTISRPRTVYAEGAYDTALAYVPRRLRFAPLPDQAYAVGFRAVVTAPRYTRADLVSALATLTVAGTLSDASLVQSYAYVCDLAGYRYYAGVSTAARAIYFHPVLGKYLLASALTVSSTPAARWESSLVTSPLGSFAPIGGATGTATITTSDTGGGEADPGTVVPLVDDAVESILLPMALQRFTASACFKNETAKPEILRQYKAALDKLHNSRASTGPMQAIWL